MQERLGDIGWSDEKKGRGCNEEEGTEKHRLYHRPCRMEVREVRNQKAGQLGAKDQRHQM